MHLAQRYAQLSISTAGASSLPASRYVSGFLIGMRCCRCGVSMIHAISGLLLPAGRTQPVLSEDESLESFRSSGPTCGSRNRINHLLSTHYTSRSGLCSVSIISTLSRPPCSGLSDAREAPDLHRWSPLDLRLLTKSQSTSGSPLSLVVPKYGS